MPAREFNCTQEMINITSDGDTLFESTFDVIHPSLTGTIRSLDRQTIYSSTSCYSCFRCFDCPFNKTILVDLNRQCWCFCNDCIFLAKDCEFSIVEVTCKHVSATGFCVFWEFVEFSIEGHDVVLSEDHCVCCNLRKNHC